MRSINWNFAMPVSQSSIYRGWQHSLMSLSSKSGRSSLVFQSPRLLHVSKDQSSPSSAIGRLGFSDGNDDVSSPQNLPAANAVKLPPLSVLPTTTVLRSYLAAAITSSSLLLPPSLAIMTALANSRSQLLNPDRNPILHYAIKKTFYAQFCAGETPQEVRHTIGGLKEIGFTGVILGYAKEVVLRDEESKSLSSSRQDERGEATKREIAEWANGTLETVRLAEVGDFVALKFTGAGSQALCCLSQRLPPPADLAAAIDSICDLAVSRGVRLLFDAEQQAVQAGIDDWTLSYMQRYNTANRCVVYGTYQAYLKATPATLSTHLRMARDGGFALGVKLVRGAYIGSDPRHLIHDTKENTDAAYDGIADAILKAKWQAPLSAKDADEKFPPAVGLVLASHNATSIRRARAIVASGCPTQDVAFGQLQGMADEVSCELLVGSGSSKPTHASSVTPLNAVQGEQPKAYKYLVWGSVGECMKYLLRRAHENRDAVERTKSGRDAMRAELWRRWAATFGRGGEKQ